MIQSLSLPAQHSRIFLRHIYVFQYLPRQKNTKNQILRNLKKYVSKNKLYFCLKKKSNVSNILNIFKPNLIMQIIYCIIHRCLYSLFILFCSLISVSKKRNIETMLTLPYSYNWQKFNNKMNEKRSQEYQSMDPEYVTGQINSRILELLLRRFCCLIFAPSQKS